MARSKGVGALLAMLAVAALSTSRRSARAAGTREPGAPGGRTRALPWVYASGVYPKLLHRWRDDALRSATERFGAHYLPGVPTTALIAAGATSTGATEHGGPPDYATGYYGVEWQWWQTVHADSETQTVLGRVGPSTYEAFDVDVEAQAFAGMRTYRRHYELVVAELRAHHRDDLAPAAPVPQWLYRLAVAGYSAGPHTVAQVLRLALAIGTTPTGATWRQLARDVDHQCPRCVEGPHTFGAVACCGRWQAADVVIRCDARFQAGRDLSTSVSNSNAEFAWYVDGAIQTADDRAVAERLTSRVNGA
jgi:hypothetical protein